MASQSQVTSFDNAYRVLSSILGDLQANLWNCTAVRIPENVKGYLLYYQGSFFIRLHRVYNRVYKQFLYRAQKLKGSAVSHSFCLTWLLASDFLSVQGCFRVVQDSRFRFGGCGLANVTNIIMLDNSFETRHLVVQIRGVGSMHVIQTHKQQDLITQQSMDKTST